MNAAPLLVSFNSVNKYLEALPEEQRNEYSEAIKQLAEKGYPPVVSAYCLAVIFGYSLSFIYSLTKKQSKYYRTFSVRNGKKIRKINSPKVSLKVIQKWLGHHLSCAIDFPPHVCGFVKGRSFVDAAKQHVGSSWVFSVDIVNFFPSISKDKISDSLKALGYSDQASILISDLCCLNGALAQGSPASPVLSNIYMSKIDSSLLSLANRYQLKVTRYADDIVFSGTNDFNPDIEKDLTSLFKNSPFQLNNEKRYLARADNGQRLKVHGLLVKEDKVTLTKGYRNKLRAYKHVLKSGKIRDEDIPRINGHIKFSEFIESTNHK